MPAGAQVVPINAAGHRELNGWRFHYKGWRHHLDAGDFWRKDATRDNIFPEDRKSKLDGELLKKMGLNRDRMIAKDALFFVQLLFPLSNPKKSGIPDDPRRDYYEEVAKFTNLYAVGKAEHGLRNHAFRTSTAEEHVNWDGVVARNTNKNLANCWNEEHENAHGPIIAGTMKYQRWLQLKRCVKLCPYYDEPEKDHADYDPTQKYAMLWDVMTFNLNAFIKKGGTDVTIDETTWPSACYDQCITA